MYGEYDSVWNAQLTRNTALETESGEYIYSTELCENPGGGSGGGGEGLSII
jgi:hypothetical protein